jgi:hypothetical protein
VPRAARSSLGRLGVVVVRGSVQHGDQPVRQGQPSKLGEPGRNVSDVPAGNDIGPALGELDVPVQPVRVR